MLATRSDAATLATSSSSQIETVTGLQFDVIGGGKMTTAAPANGSIYPSLTSAQLVTALTVAPGRSLTSLKIFAAGTATLKVTLLLHDVVRNGFVGGSPVAQVTAAPTGGAIVVPIPSPGVAVAEGQKLEVWVSGATSSTPLSGLVYSTDITSAAVMRMRPSQLYFMMR